MGVAFSPDGKRIASAEGGIIKVWNAESGEEQFTLKELAGGMNDLSFSPNGKLILKGGTLWNSTTGQKIRSLGGGKSTSFSPDGEWVVGARGGTVTVWSTSRVREAGRLKPRAVGPTTVRRPDGKRMFSTREQGDVKVWLGAPDGGPRTLLLKCKANRVKFSENGTRIVTVSPGANKPQTGMRVWDALTGKEIGMLTTADPAGHENVREILFSPNGKRIVTSNYVPTDKSQPIVYNRGKIKLWDAVSAREMATLDDNLLFNSKLYFTPDGRRIVFTAWNPYGFSPYQGKVKVWDAKTGKTVVSLDERPLGRPNVAYSLKANAIAVGSSAETLRIFDADSGKERDTFKGHSGGITGVAFSADDCLGGSA